MMAKYDTRFYDFCTRPDNLELMAAGARSYGYSGIAVMDLRKYKDPTLPDDFSIYEGIEIAAKPLKIKQEIKKQKDSHFISIVRGGDEAINRAAVESEGLDILLAPREFNNVLAKTASDNSVAIGFDLGSIIRQRGDMRVRELRIMRTNLKHARKYKLQMILTADPVSVYDLRSPREMVALSSLFGMTQNEAIDALSTAPEHILRKKDPNYIQEGIEIL